MALRIKKEQARPIGVRHDAALPGCDGKRQRKSGRKKEASDAAEMKVLEATENFRVAGGRGQLGPAD